MNGDIVYAATDLARNDEEIIHKASSVAGMYIEQVKVHSFDSLDMAERLEKEIAKEDKRFKANHDWILAYESGAGCIYDISLKGIKHLKEAAMCLVRKSEFEKALALI